MLPVDPENISTNPSSNEHFQDVVDRVVMNRRHVIKSGLGLSAAMFMGGALGGCAEETNTTNNTTTNTNNTTNNTVINNGGSGSAPDATISFEPIAISTDDDIKVPAGYAAAVLAPWGTPLIAGAPAWKNDLTEDSAAQEKQVGEHHDGMHYFEIPGIDGNSEGLLVVNHEYCDYPDFFAGFRAAGSAAFFADPTKWTADKAKKAQYAHGASVIHIKRDGSGKWDIVAGSTYNRRIHAATPMELTGPVVGHALVKTSADPDGKNVLGTFNNCGNGHTPWGTYLTCEENFNGYFGTLNSGTDNRNDNHKRYGIGNARSGYRWEDFEDRFDFNKEPNEPNRHGWIVEIDPLNPASKPQKRTALGRIKHENVAIAHAKNGRIVAYMGDDQAGDYVYKFISSGTFDKANPKATAHRKLLETGKLYVAKFNDGRFSGDFAGDGEWILLDVGTATTDGSTLGAKFNNSLAEILVNTRLAADAVGATKMDRPEWVTVHPVTQQAYLTLTNNSGRALADINDANPRAANRYGQIIRWSEKDSDPGSVENFKWDLFVLAGNPNVHGDLRAGSDNITTNNTFNSPDGLAFDADGRLWIQTDGAYTNAGDYLGQGNNQMLVADVHTKEIKRFLTGPKECEITGLAWTPDGKTLFINVQHPGESTGPAGSSWPSTTAGDFPRSATVVITKNDGGKIGL